MSELPAVLIKTRWPDVRPIAWDCLTLDRFLEFDPHRESQVRLFPENMLAVLVTLMIYLGWQLSDSITQDCGLLRQ